MDTDHEKPQSLHGKSPVLLLGQLARFNLVGIVNTAVDFAVFFLLDSLGLPYLPAQACSYACGIVNSYLCNKYWTFGTPGLKAGEMMRFVTVNLAGLGISLLLVYLFHGLLGLTLFPAKTAATFFTMLLSFFGNRLWVFRNAARSPGPAR
ncbi:GtrA family protein [Geotalea sp. SG265]|uniref:GtrA family protein n=1 Tax=Geotalea sp. SG265 TaxID=2922867 RepID=UPI001FAE8B51|nr:GtrA family protein [Geotalea sp. SG265]